MANEQLKVNPSEDLLERARSLISVARMIIVLQLKKATPEEKPILEKYMKECLEVRRELATAQLISPSTAMKNYTRGQAEAVKNYNPDGEACSAGHHIKRKQ